MATKVQLGGTDDDRIFLDTDQTRDFEILDTDAMKVAVDPLTPIMKDLSGMNMTFDVRRQDATSTVLLTKAATIVGTFSTVRASNTQRARVTLADTDLSTATFGAETSKCRYSLKRTDDGSETILAYGDFVIERVTQASVA